MFQLFRQCLAERIEAVLGLIQVVHAGNIGCLGQRHKIPTIRGPQKSTSLQQKAETSNWSLVLSIMTATGNTHAQSSGRKGARGRNFWATISAWRCWQSQINWLFPGSANHGTPLDCEHSTALETEITEIIGNIVGPPGGIVGTCYSKRTHTKWDSMCLFWRHRRWNDLDVSKCPTAYPEGL